jgi:hypothetical protein
MVRDIVGRPLCVAADDGERVCEKVSQLLRGGLPVVLSFEGVDLLTAVFLNAAVGSLYGEFSGDCIRSLVTVSDMAGDDRAILRAVVDNAQRYFSTREAERVWSDHDDQHSE